MSTRRAVKTVGRAMALAVGWALLSPLWSCAETSGESIEFDTAVTASTSTGEPVQSFTNLRGWTIELSEAYVVVGPIYFYSEPPQASLLDGVLGARSAYACAAHAQYDRGTVLGEVLLQYVVDLLSGELEDTGRSRGQAGTCQSAELHLHPPGQLQLGVTSLDPALLQGHTIWVAGTASKEATTIAFEGGLTVPDEASMRIVESIEAAMAMADASEQGGRAVVEVLLDQWFANVEFDTLPESSSGAPRVFETDTQAHTAWLSGVRSRYAYRATWREQ